MKKLFGFCTAAVCITLLCTVGCHISSDNDGLVRVMIERGEHFTVLSPLKDIPKNSDVSFSIILDEEYFISFVNYDDYTVSQSVSGTAITIRNVQYSAIIKIGTSANVITYDANGGQSINGSQDTLTVVASLSHLRVNTALGSRIFYRDGYVLTGWNTKADGSGKHIGLGSRIVWEKGLVIYAEWAKANDIADFEWSIENGQTVITGYHGFGKTIVVPETIEGVPVNKISANAFENCVATTLILPDSLRIIEDNAFIRSAFREIYLFDNLTKISDASFAECRDLERLHINAGRNPTYSGSYFDAFTDKTDRLESLAGKKKLVLFAGSSARYGYDSAKIQAAFPQYSVTNMGVFAYTGARAQLDIIRTFMSDGDVLLSSPEFDSVEDQFCASPALDENIFAMVESDYDLFARIDLREYTNIFDAFAGFLRVKNTSEEKGYNISAGSFDDDGNSVPYDTYNEYGDYVLFRTNAEKDEMHRFIPADYTVNSFPAKTIEALNREYAKFTDIGIKVLFTYAPRNRSSLTKESTEQAISDLHKYLVDNLNVPVISDIKNSLMSGIYFYVIDNHLSTEGVAIHTQNIIDDLSFVL